MEAFYIVLIVLSIGLYFSPASGSINLLKFRIKQSGKTPTKAFKDMDALSNGLLSKKEFTSGLNRLKIRGKIVNKLFNKIDADGNSRIDIGEFKNALTPALSASRKALILKSFNKMDKNNDGVITAKQDKVTKRYITQYDTNKDRKVSQAEFLNYYQKVGASYTNDADFETAMRNLFGLP